MLLMGRACTVDEGCVVPVQLGCVYDYASNNDCVD